MKKNIISSVIVTSAAFALLGCGGGGSSDPVAPATVTGQFVDTYVAGLNYTCSSGTTGITNSDGEYTCNVGDTVEFSLGGYMLGRTTASAGIVTPGTLYPDNEEAALNVAQLLQTLDNDSSDGIITIPDNFSGLDDVETSPTADNFDSVMESELGQSLVSEDDAQEHMEETELRILFAERTLYTTIWDDEGTLESWAFNREMTQATWTEIVGGDESGTVTITGINGSRITVVDDEGTTVIEVEERLDDYLVVQVTGGDLGDEIETLRLYFDEAQAREYLLAGPPTPDLTTLLAGRTLYTTIWDDEGTLESWTFNADLTSSTWTELVGGSATGTGTLVIDGMTMTFTCTSDSEQECESNPSTIEVKEVLTDYLIVEVRGGELGDEIETLRLYFDEAQAREYLINPGVGVPAPFVNHFANMISGQTLYQVWYGMGVDANGDDIDNVAVLAKVTFNANGTAEYVGLMHEESGSGQWEVTDDKLVLVGTSENFDYSEYNQYVSGDLASGCIQTNWVNENNASDNNVDLFFTNEITARNYANTLTSTASCP
jgi:hypothetical protein